MQISIDGEALDQQLLSTGVTDRNVDEFLGLIEQRIDELIQVDSKTILTDWLTITMPFEGW